MSNDVDKSVPIPEPKKSSRKWFGDDQPMRNKVLKFPGTEWYGELPAPPSLDESTISKINEMIANGQEPKIVLQDNRSKAKERRQEPDVLSTTLASLDMKREGNRFVKNEDDE